METQLISNILKSLFASILLSTWFSLLFSQSADLKFQRYTVLDGIAQGYVLCMVQDYRGFLWIGTGKGLNRFDGYNFSVYSPDRDDPASLFSDAISALFEDSKGRLWVGCGQSEGGLHLYNREQDNFIRILPDPDQPFVPGKSNIHAIAEDQAGFIWLGTPLGITVFNPELNQKEYTHFRHDENVPSSLMANNITDIYIDSKNRVWIGTESGLDLYDSESESFIHFVHNEEDPNSLSDNDINAITEDHYGTIWIGTFDGLNKLVHNNTEPILPGNIEFIRYHNDPTNPNSISNNNIVSLHCDQTGTLWIGSDEGINRLAMEELTKGMKDSQSSLEFQGYQNNPLDTESLNYNYVKTIFTDVSGTLWVGTSTGLNKQKNYKFRHLTQDPSEHSLASNKIQAIFEDSRGIIWIGSSKGLNQFNPRTNTFKYVMPGRIMSISEDQQGDLWIGRWLDGLMQYNPLNNEIHSYMPRENDPTSLGSNSMFKTFVDSENNVWICTWGGGGGLNLFNRENQTFTRFTDGRNDSDNLSINNVSTVFEDHKGTLWVGTAKGLNRLVDKERGVFETYFHDPADKSSISHNDINCIYETRNGSIWIGTSEGLNKLNNSDNSFVSYIRSGGLPDDAIMGILEDDHNNLWISTSNGIFKLMVTSDEELDDAFENHTHALSIIQSSALNDTDRLFLKGFDIDDGLQSKEFVARACLKSSSGELYFGGINGLNIFHPDSIHDNIHAPEVVFTSLQLFNKEVSMGEVINGDTILKQSITETDEIILSYKNNIFSIEYSALHFVAPDQNQYAYKLEGFEDQWNFVNTQHKASYTNLDPGEYVFTVRASNNDGVWNNEATSLGIIVTPPFWETWWFKVLLIVLVIGITFVVIEIRLNTIKNQKKILEIKVKERTEQIVKQKQRVEDQKQQVQDQATKINKLNEVLKKHNLELEDNVHHLSEARVMQRLIGFGEFKKIYPDETACHKFLEELKWQSRFACKKCGSPEYSKEEHTLARRCKKCNYKESVTSGTIFHRLRFPIDKAFYILILTSTGRDINISQLSDTISLRMKTCWEFHNKVKSIMQTRKRFKNPKEGWKELIILSTKNVKAVN